LNKLKIILIKNFKEKIMSGPTRRTIDQALLDSSLIKAADDGNFKLIEDLKPKVLILMLKILQEALLFIMLL
jgi:hypothetical protein